MGWHSTFKLMACLQLVANLSWELPTTTYLVRSFIGRRYSVTYLFLDPFCLWSASNRMPLALWPDSPLSEVYCFIQSNQSFGSWCFYSLLRVKWSNLLSHLHCPDRSFRWLAVLSPAHSSVSPSPPFSFPCTDPWPSRSRFDCPPETTLRCCRIWVWGIWRLSPVPAPDP